MSFHHPSTFQGAAAWKPSQLQSMDASIFSRCGVLLMNTFYLAGLRENFLFFMNVRLNNQPTRVKPEVQSRSGHVSENAFC